MNKTHLLEVVSVLFTIVAFVWEFRRATTEEKIILWALIGALFIL